MTDAQFGALMLLVGGIITASFTYLGIRIKEKLAAKGTVTVAEINYQQAFVGRLVERLDAVEKASDQNRIAAADCERRCSDQVQVIAKQAAEIDDLKKSRASDKSEIEMMQTRIDVLSRGNRRLEARIVQMEDGLNGSGKT